MDAKPKRRWFRFRLSTVLILTAILAWGMATRPYFVGVNERYGLPGNVRPYAWQDTKQEVNPRLLRPAFALFAFVAWKAAWAVVERRRRKLVASE